MIKGRLVLAAGDDAEAGDEAEAGNDAEAGDDADVDVRKKGDCWQAVEADAVYSSRLQTVSQYWFQ